MLQSILEALSSGKITIIEYINQIKALSLEPKALSDELENLIVTDELMNGIVLLWIYKYHLFKNLKAKKDGYLSFFDGLQSYIIDDDITPILLNDYNAIIKFSKLYIIINQDKDYVKISLPSAIKNNHFYCYNCNDQMFLKDVLELPDYSFYILIND